MIEEKKCGCGRSYLPSQGCLCTRINPMTHIELLFKHFFGYSFIWKGNPVTIHRVEHVDFKGDTLAIFFLSNYKTIQILLAKGKEKLLTKP